MRVRFILPALAEAERGLFRPIKYALFPPLGLATLAGYLEPDDEIELYDQHVEPVPEDGEPDLVAIEVYITSAHRAYAMADRYRARGIFVVMGGLHPTSLPEEALRHADAVVLGPAHAAWPEFLRDFRRRNTRKIYADQVRTLKTVPPVRRDLIKRRNYLAPNSIVVSRGCPQSCDFCYTRNFFAGGRQFYTAPVDRALAEIESLPGRHLFFLDDNLFGSERFVRELFAGMRGMRRLFQGAATVRSLQNDALLEAAAEAGLRSLFIGFESLNPESLAACHKTINRIDEYAETVRRLHAHGIMVNASFVFGLPADRADVFDRTVEWAVSTGIESATFHLATPYPGTPFFRAMERERRLLHRDWERYDTRHAVIRHDHLTPEELEAGYWRSYREFYRWHNILRGASHQPSFGKALRHAGYSAAWKKVDPLWNLLIRLHRLAPASRLLEKVLDL